jgi:putative N6-adenine-specific DNA methylase
VSDFFATAAKGTEGALRDELRELRLPMVKADRGGVHFGGGLTDGVRACYESRIAQRILLRLGSFAAPSPEALYAGVRSVDWSRVLDRRRTLSVTAHVKSSAMRHSGFVAQKTKDAIVDQLRERFGGRPDVDRDDPDVHVVVHLSKDEAQVFADLAGEPLHRRGYRTEAREAPLKETLAAAMLRLAGWDRTRPLLDPMCGSGTIAIEGYLWAYDIAPGFLRKRYGFERWASYDETTKRFLGDLRAAARERIRREGPSVMALDIDREAVRLSRTLSRRAGASIQVEHGDVADFFGSEPPGHVVTNPPYGVRLARGEHFEVMLAHAFRRLTGHRISVLCHDRNLEQAMRKKPVQEHALWNGDLECRLYSWET